MAKEKKSSKISSREKDFVLNYLLLRNATKAYLKTFPNTKYDSARTLGARLFAKVRIQDEIQKYLEEVWKKKEKEISRVFDKLISVAGADISDYIDEHGDVCVDEFKSINTYPIAEYTQSISDTKEGQNVKRTIKMKDSLKALSDLTKILGMIQEKVEHSGTIIVKRAVRPDRNKDA